MANKIFLSYSHKDKAIVALLRRELVRAGLEVWMDDHEIEPGDILINEISTNLISVDYFCVVLSKNSVVSNWVKFELEEARSYEISNNKLTVVPIVIDDCQVPNLVKTKYYSKFHVPDLFEKELDKLIKKLGGIENENSYSFGILYDFNDLVQDFRRRKTSKLDVLLINGGATIPALIDPHIEEVISDNKIDIRFVFLNNNYSRLAEQHDFEDGYDALKGKNWNIKEHQRIYEALVLESNCLQNIGIHEKQVDRSISTFANLKKENVNISIRNNSRLPFCRLLILDDVIYYTPFLNAKPFMFYTFKLTQNHPMFDYCRSHFDFMYTTGNDVEF